MTMSSSSYGSRAVTRHDIDWLVGELRAMQQAPRPQLSDYPVHWSGSAQLPGLRTYLLGELIEYLENRPLVP